MKRRIKIFVSYSHADKALARQLAAWLQQNGCEPLVDERKIKPSHVLNATLTDMIDRSDGCIALGTANLMKSNWCQQEVEYALLKQKKYLPCLLEPVDKADWAKWFTQAGSLKGEIVVANCLRSNFEALEEFIKLLRERQPVKPVTVVLLSSIFLCIIPILISWTIHDRVGKANRHIRELQQWIQQLNSDIDTRHSGNRSIGMVLDPQDPTQINYVDAQSGDVLAKDYCAAGKLSRRIFFQNGQEVGNDSFEILTSASDSLATSGQVSLIKKRQIYPQGINGFVIEETFDSTGKLISKQARASQQDEWERYGDTGSSLYPPGLFCPYR